MPLTPAEEQELAGLLALINGSGGNDPSTGDSLVDLASNVGRGVQAGFTDIANMVVPPETFDPVMQSLQAVDRMPEGFDPAGVRQPPVGAGYGYRAAQSVGRTLPTLPLGGPLAQLGVGALGGVVAEGTERVTGSPLAGNIAELATNVGTLAAPYAARGLFRGASGAPGTTGAEVAGEMADRAITGVNTGVGPATQGRTVPDTLQSFAEKVPGGRGFMQDFQRRVAEDFRQAVDRFTGLMGRHAESADFTRAGLRVQRDIARSRDALDARMAQITSRINVAPTSPVELSALQQTLQAMGSRATGIDALDALAATPAMRTAGQVAQQGLPPVSYEAAIRLRAQIGRRLKNAGLVSDISTGELKQLYGALTDDIGRTVEQRAGPQGRQLWDQSRRLWRREMTRFEDDLERIANITDPARAAELVTKSPRSLYVIRRQVSPETYDTLVAATFNDLGQAVASQQNAAGTVWSVESFLTNWNRLGHQSREALLAGPRYAQAREGLNALARQAERMRVIDRRISNTSGTARGLTDVATVGAVAGAVASGQVWPAIAAGLSVGASYGSARLMTNPRFLSWMNQAVKVEPRQVGAMALRLTGMIRDGGWTPEEAEAAANVAAQLQQQMMTTRN